MNKKYMLMGLLTFTTAIWSYGQPAPLREATVAEMQAATQGMPAVVTPRRASVSSAFVPSVSGSSTNQYLRDATATNMTLVSAIWKPTNTYTGVGLIGGVAGTSVITNDTPGGFSNVHAGDNFAAGNQQLTVQWVNNPSNAFVFETLQIPWSKSNYVVYPNAQYGTDVNGTLVVNSVGNDGTFSVIGRNGGNSGKIELLSDRIGGAWQFQINSGGAFTLNTKGNNGGGVITIETNATYEDIHIKGDGSVSFKDGLTNIQGGVLTVLSKLTVNKDFSAATNTASVNTASNTITLGSNFSNDTGARAQWLAQFSFTDAVATSPVLVISNMTANWVITNSHPNGVVTVFADTVLTPVCSPNDVLRAYDISGAGSSVSFVKSWWIKQ